MMKNYVLIPEDTITSAADMMGHLFPDNSEFSFNKILNRINKFKEAGCTPLILLDPDTYIIYVVAEETLGKKLH